MELATYFKSIIDQDRDSIVICDLNHIIIYMNPSATNHFSKRGGSSLVGKSLFDCHNEKSKDLIEKVVEFFRKDESNNIIHTFYNEQQSKDVYMVALRDENKNLIGYYEKHEYRTKDNMPFYEFED